MKFKQLDLRNYNQFKKLSLVLTYPEGHKKAGQPLDRICIIGQSGTGKTTLLSFINSLLSNKFISAIKYSATLEIDGKSYTERDLTSQQLPRISSMFNSPIPLAILLPADFLSNNMGVIGSRDFTTHSGNIYDFGKYNIKSIWHRILDDIKRHKQQEITIRTQIEKISKITDKPAKELKQQLDPLYEKLVRLEEVENNPLKKIADECLDIVLSNFNLKVDTNFSVTEDLNKLEFIRIIDKTGKIIPNGVLSTGTLQFILSSLPFYLLKPKDAIILFDEPERSLYPNIQKLLVDHYAKFAPDCQFIYATHSPIIASCFDPWEVIELQFNDEGYVEQKPYFDGDRHVKNYKIHPKYLTYDLILNDVFNVKNTEGEDRSRSLSELIMLENELKQFKAKEDNSSDEFHTAMNKYKELGDLLSWPVKFN